MPVPINYPAVFVAALFQFILGWVWFGPLFGKKWAELMGINMAQKPSSASMAKIMSISFVGSLLMSDVLAHTIAFANAYAHSIGMTPGAVFGGIMAGFWNWLGFIAPVTVGAVLWQGKPWTVWFITSGYYLVSLVIMGILLNSWA